MAARFGLAPWSQGYKRVTKRDLQSQGIEWSLSSGYRSAEWDKKPGKPKTKKVKLYNGRTVEVPDADFEEFIGYQRSPTSKDFEEIGQYIDKAFADMSKVQDFDGVGHITYVEYAPTYQLLRVEFASDGAVVVFFRVPKEVYSELYYLAQSGATSISTVDGKERHLLGMRFWDIVRIRGNRSGTRYRFEYAMEGTRAGPQTAETETALPAGTTQKDVTSLYDKLARNHLVGKRLDEYNSQSTLIEKMKFLKKANII